MGGVFFCLKTVEQACFSRKYGSSMAMSKTLTDNTAKTKKALRTSSFDPQISANRPQRTTSCNICTGKQYSLHMCPLQQEGKSWSLTSWKSLIMSAWASTKDLPRGPKYRSECKKLYLEISSYSIGKDKVELTNFGVIRHAYKHWCINFQPVQGGIGVTKP